MWHLYLWTTKKSILPPSLPIAAYKHQLLLAGRLREPVQLLQLNAVAVELTAAALLAVCVRHFPSSSFPAGSMLFSSDMPPLLR